MVGALLAGEGYEVTETPSGVEAVARVREGEPDVALVDLMMPGELDGMATLGRLRETAPDLPVIMMSGRAGLADAVKATKLGAFNFLEKPLTPEGVLLAVSSALELRQTRRVATAQRTGRFELPHNGTLFLDEVGDLGPDAQAKLLRAIEAKEIQRVGGNRVIRADVRIISATNHDLQRAVRAGTFREDLYFRLQVIPLAIPPLRERGDDILELVEHFSEQFLQRTGQAKPRWRSDALQLLRDYPWPGNVRELANIVERLAILHPGAEISGPQVEDVLIVDRDEEEDLAVITPTRAQERLGLWARTSRASGLILSSGKTYNRVEGVPVLFGPVLHDSVRSAELNASVMGIIRSANSFHWDSQNLGHRITAEMRVGRGRGYALGVSTFDVMTTVELWKITNTDAGLATSVGHRY